MTEMTLFRKRMRRVLRAVGIVPPHQRAARVEHAVRDIPLIRSEVADLYALILKREAEATELDSHVAALASGRVTTVEVVRSLMESEEFGSASLRNANVATRLSTAVLGALAGISDENAVRAYATGLMGAMPVESFIREICAGEEFRAVWNLASVEALPGETRIVYQPAPATAQSGSGEIGLMIENLVIARMIGEGAVLGMPPLDPANRTAPSTSQIMALIRTLDMMADRPLRH